MTGEPLRPTDRFLAEYGESHQNQTNKFIRRFCVANRAMVAFVLQASTVSSDRPRMAYAFSVSTGRNPVLR